MRAGTKTIDEDIPMPELSKRLADYEASLIAELFAQALDLIEQGSIRKDRGIDQQVVFSNNDWKFCGEVILCKETAG